MNIENAMFGLAVYLQVAFFALFIERFCSRGNLSESAVWLNYAVTGFNALFNGLIGPVLAVFTVTAVNAMGGGWIDLPSSGSGLLIGFIAYTLTTDGLEYAFHRAQHRFPWLWAMHSLHHSDTHLCSASTGRHFWADHIIKVCTIYLVLGIVFRANPAVLGMYALLAFYNFFPHMSLRIGFGRLSYLMNSPQYHRIHHSSLPQHYNCNFAALFPIFDVIFRTYRQPKAGEFPQTGIEGYVKPCTLFEALIWPARMRQLAREQSSSPPD